MVQRPSNKGDNSELHLLPSEFPFGSVFNLCNLDIDCLNFFFYYLSESLKCRSIFTCKLVVYQLFVGYVKPKYISDCMRLLTALPII